MITAQVKNNGTRSNKLLNLHANLQSNQENEITIVLKKIREERILKNLKQQKARAFEQINVALEAITRRANKDFFLI